MSRHVHHDGVILFVWGNELSRGISLKFPSFSGCRSIIACFDSKWLSSNALSQTSAKNDKKALKFKIIPSTITPLYFLYTVQHSRKINSFQLVFDNTDINHLFVWLKACHSRIQTYLPFQSKPTVTMKVEWMKGALTGTVSFASLSVVLWAQHYYRTSRSPVFPRWTELNWSWEPRAAQWSPVRHKPTALSCRARVTHTSGVRESSLQRNFPDSPFSKTITQCLQLVHWYLLVF